jgi:hypothetical protein
LAIIADVGNRPAADFDEYECAATSGACHGKPIEKEDAIMSTMRQILREVEASGTRAPVGEAVSAAVVDRMAQAMLDSTKLASLTSRAMDADQLEMFNGLILEPLRALVAKALDVAGVAVSGGLLAKAGREMKSAARGNIGAE